MKLIGPFSQLITLRGLAANGPLADEQLEIVTAGGLVIDNGRGVDAGNFDALHRQYPQLNVEQIVGQQTVIPGFIDAHTHICFAGSRANDYAARVAGRTYLEIAKKGGGIWDTVTKTRAMPQTELANRTAARADRALQAG